MGRWIGGIVFLTALGAMLGLLIALACALWSIPSSATTHVNFGSPRSWSRATPPDWPRTELNQTTYRRGFGIRYRMLRGHDATKRNAPPSEWTPPDRYGFAELQVGWPFLCLGAYRPYDELEADDVDGWFLNLSVNVALADGSPNSLNSSRWHNLIVLPSRSNMHLLDSGRALPTKPLWLGLAANTIILGGVPLMVYLSIVWLRERRRSKRGRCERCGYDLAGLVDCPECGTPQASARQRDLKDG